jgi:peroxiredoxin
LKSTPDQEISLDDFRGQPLMLAFYPADFSPVCSSELSLFNELLPEFRKHNAMLLGISVDSVWCHLAFAQQSNLHFPLLADFHPKGEVAKQYNAFRDDVGECARALYVIDKEGIVAWSYISPVGVNPGADGLLGALEELSRRS